MMLGGMMLCVSLLAFLDSCGYVGVYEKVDLMLDEISGRKS
jgi:hypothetical protein